MQVTLLPWASNNYITSTNKLWYHSTFTSTLTNLHIVQNFRIQMHQCITTLLNILKLYLPCPTIATVQTAEYGMCYYCPFSTEQCNPTHRNASDHSIATTRCTNLSVCLCVKHCKWVLILPLLPQCRFLFRSCSCTQ